MKKKFFTLGSLAVATILSSTAFAYTVQGTVADEDGKAVKDAKVDLLQEKKSAVTDEKGEFTIHEDEIDTTKEAISFRAMNSVGYIGVNSGILSYSQSSVSPVQVRIFDAMGNQVFKKVLQGSGEMDLRKSIKGQGTYFAQVSVGSAKQNFKFTTDGNYSASIKRREPEQGSRQGRGAPHCCRRLRHFERSSYKPRYNPQADSQEERPEGKAVRFRLRTR